MSIATSELNYTGPVIIVTGFGTGESARYLTFFMRLIINLFLKDQYKDKTRLEEIIADSPMNWEFVKPGMLTNGSLTSSYQVTSELSKELKINKISRADVADYLVKEVEDPRYLRRQVVLTV